MAHSKRLPTTVAIFVKLLSLFLCSQAVAAVDEARNATTVKLGVVLNGGTASVYDYYHLGPAINLAAVRVLEKFNVDFDVVPYIYPGQCGTGELAALGQVIKALSDSVQAIIGPLCTDDLVIAAKLTTLYNVSLLTGGGSLIENTLSWPYVTRTAYNIKTQWMFFALICQQYNWTNVFVLYEDINYYGNMGTILVKYLRSKGITPIDYPVRGTEAFGPKRIDGILDDAAQQARVIVVVLTSKKIRQVLTQAQRRGTFCTGEYAFFAVDLLKTDLVQSPFYQKNTDDDRPEPALCSALFVITLRYSQTGPQFLAFQQRVWRQAQTAPGAQPPDVNYYSSTYYDAVFVYGEVLSETLNDGRNLTRTNAAYINQKLNNRSFNGSLGITSLDATGDGSSDYQLYQMLPSEYTFGDSTRRFTRVAEYYSIRGVIETLRPIRWLNPNNTPTSNRPRCGYDGYDPVCVSVERTTLGAALGGVLFFLLIGGGLGFLTYRHTAYRSELNNLDWLAAWSDIIVHRRYISNRSVAVTNSYQLDGSNVVPMSRPRLKSNQSIQKSNTTTRESILKTNTIVATFHNTLVILRPCKGVHVTLSKKVREEVRVVKGFTCENLAKFVAACIEVDHVTVLGEFCSRGTLQEVLQNDTVVLDWVFRHSFVNDTVSALIYLQASSLEYHGRLSSRCCLIDKRFLLKVSDYGLSSFYDKVKTAYMASDLLWTAPEILRATDAKSTFSPEGDMFAFAIILHEIVLRESPYYLNNIGAEEIIQRVKHGERPALRPIVQDVFCPDEIMNIMRSGWAEDPAERPKFAQVRAALRNSAKANGRQRENIIDTLIERMEQYAATLEISVDEKTQALVEEKKKTEQLLYSILPRGVAEQLKRGEPVLPESYDSVTIYFGDIVGFTTLSAASSPFEIVTLMNDLYGQFDQIISTFDAYKVETIGDCYVIVSGLPNRNGQKHAGIIARLAMTLRGSMATFKVQHMPDKILQLRIGLNSGPCVAGVVGFATPRYCLFGDTVNVAARMESTGAAMKIQMTQSTAAILDYLGSFEMEERGVVQIKGKGDMRTFWLIRERLPQALSTETKS